MTTQVIMPQLGESVVEGTVIQWLKQVGDQVEELESLLEINTDKVDTEIPSPASGVLLKIYVEEGQTVAAGTLLAVLGEPGEEAPEIPLQPETVARTAEPAPASETTRHSAPAADPAGGKMRQPGFISPVVARIAAQEKVDLTKVPGTGRGGRITKKDVLAYLRRRTEAPAEAASPWEQPASGELFRPTEEIFGVKGAPAAAQAPVATPGSLLPLDIVRRTIAEHMVRSKKTSPHVTTVMEADLTRVIAHQKAHKEAFAREGINLTFTAYFVAAVVEALAAVPIVNASWHEEGIQLHRELNVGIAVSLGEQGLIVPVIKNAGQRSLRGLAMAINDLAGRARARKLKPDEVQGGTFTITNHGVSGSLLSTPIINQPQAAILGVGAIQKRVVVTEVPDSDGGVADAMTIRPMMYLSLTFDHRILDGAVADRFLGLVVGKLSSWA